MAKKLNSPSTGELTRAIQANMWSALRVTAENMPQGEYAEEADVRWYRTGVLVPKYNMICDPRFTVSSAAQRIQEVSAGFIEAGVPFQWLLGPGAKPEGLGDHLEECGFEPEAPLPGMAMPLAELDTSKVNKELEMVEVSPDDEESLKTFAETTSAGFGIPGELAPQIASLFAPAAGAAPDPSTRIWVGTLDGEPVASGVLFLAAGVAGVYFIATVNEARGQGFGATVTIKMLQAARGMGYKIGILHSTEAGFPLYQKLGFKTYCQLRPYAWAGDDTGGG